MLAILCLICSQMPTVATPASPQAHIIALQGFKEGLKAQRTLISARFSEDASLLVAVSSDKAARVWEVNTGVLIATVRDGDAPFYDATFLSRGRWIATCGAWMPVNNGRGTSYAGGLLRVWDYKTGNEIFRFATNAALHSIAMSTGERFISCFDRDSQFHAIDTYKDRKVAVIADFTAKPPIQDQDWAGGHRIGDQVGIGASGLLAVATWGESDVLVLNAEDATTRILPCQEIVQTAKLPPRPYPGYAVRKIALSPEGSDIAVSLLGCRDTVHLLRLKPLGLKSVLSLEPSEEVSLITFDGTKHLALAAESGKVSIFDQSGGPPKAVAARPGRPVAAMRFSEDKLRILWGPKRTPGKPTDTPDANDRGLCVETLLIPQD